MVLQNGLYCVAIWAVLHCDIGHIGGRYDTFRGAEKAVLGAEKGGFGGWFYCTIGLIRPISPIRPISYGCTLIFREFAAGAVLFSNSRNFRGFMAPKLTVERFVHLRWAARRFCSQDTCSPCFFAMDGR